ncbi:MAG: Gfo/Idh/MocA family oxidoreductase [Clostridia bacterium]
MKDTIKIGVIGLGCRGFSLLESIMLPMEDIEVVAVCDLYIDRVIKGAKAIKDAKGIEPICATDYKKIVNIKEIDAIIIATSWEDHIAIAIAAMRAGKYVGMEVGGAYSLNDCWELVYTSKITKMPCMLLENCCYGRTEMMNLNMVKKGLFGDIVHCAGGYQHDLREEISYGKENRHYRLRNYLSRNCENYPTHELGPIAKILNINRGNRMVSLASIASKSCGLHNYILEKKGTNDILSNAVFAQGDIVTTTIKCLNGETIVLTLDTTLPRAYCRGLNVRGTKGCYAEETDSIFIDGVHNKFDLEWKKQWGNAEQYYEKYDHPLWKDYLKLDVKGGHGGIDWLVFRAFFESAKNETQTPIDVYDTASWMCISTLSEDSIAKGGALVSIPDFTNGKWIEREDFVKSKYCLNEIVEDLED